MHDIKLIAQLTPLKSQRVYSSTQYAFAFWQNSKPPSSAMFVCLSVCLYVTSCWKTSFNKDNSCKVNKICFSSWNTQLWRAARYKLYNTIEHNMTYYKIDNESCNYHIHILPFLGYKLVKNITEIKVILIPEKTHMCELIYKSKLLIILANMDKHIENVWVYRTWSCKNTFNYIKLKESKHS